MCRCPASSTSSGQEQAKMNARPPLPAALVRRAYVYFEDAGRRSAAKVAHEGRGAADCGQRGETAGNCCKRPESSAHKPTKLKYTETNNRGCQNHKWPRHPLPKSASRRLCPSERFFVNCSAILIFNSSRVRSLLSQSCGRKRHKYRLHYHQASASDDLIKLASCPPSPC